MNSINPSNPIITKKTIVAGVLAILGLILFLIVNPFSWNDAGNRTVVERTTGATALFVGHQAGLAFGGRRFNHYTT